MRKNNTIAFVYLLLSVFLTIQPGNTSDLKKAVIFRKSHEYKQALELITRYLKNVPDDQNALFTKGLIFIDLERYTESIDIFEQLIKKYPATPELYNNLAIVLAFSGKYEDSQKAFQKALHLQNNYREAHKNLDALKFAKTYREYLIQADKKNVRFDKKKLLASIQNQSQNDRNLQTCHKLLESQILTREIQSNLMKLGYYQGKINGTFHSGIRSAIQEFQRFHQLPVKGFISWHLLAKIQDVIDEKKLQPLNKQEKTLTQMQRKRLTQKIQHGLYDLGYSPGPQNSEFHEQTQQALNQFIDDHSINDTPEISFAIAGHIMKALYHLQGKWTVVPVQPDDICANFVPLMEFINSGYKPIHYIGYATILGHQTEPHIMITNSSAHCRDMKKLVGAKKIQN